MNEPGGRIVHRFHGRDLNLVLDTQTDGGSMCFQVLIDGEPPNGARGLDVDERGNGTVTEERLYQLIRQNGQITDRTFEITFIDAGARPCAVALADGTLHGRQADRAGTSTSAISTPAGGRYPVLLLLAGLRHSAVGMRRSVSE
jgi:hypothetical protein